MKLLEVSRSLTKDEVHELKFLAKSKLRVDHQRYEEIKHGYELFDELENSEQLTHIFVGELLKRINRFDLVDNLARPGTGKRPFPLL